MGFQHMLVAEHGLGFQMFKSGENVRGEGVMLEVLDGLGVLLAGEVAQVAAGCEFSEGIERHQARDWRR